MTALGLFFAAAVGAGCCAPADSAPPPLAILPVAAAPAGSPDNADLEAAGEALRLAVTVTGRFRVLGAEEVAPRFGGAARVPRSCFTASCAASAGRKTKARWVLVSELERPGGDSGLTLKLVLFDMASGKAAEAVRARKAAGDSTGLLSFAKAAAFALLGEEPDPAAAFGALDSASGDWRGIPWLNRKERIDNRHTWTWAGAGVLAAAIAMAYVEGQLFQEDDNDHAPGGALLDPDGATPSFLRGFFAAPTLGAQYAAMGGAGMAQVDNALAVLFDPAGVADVVNQSVVMAKRSLPDGTPSFFLAYAGPLWGKWSQGLGVQYEGDGLANETTFNGDLAFDWSALGEGFGWLKTGAGLKIYLAKVGAEGAGYDRSTGHSFGMGLDLGLRVRLSARITAALSVRDAASFLRHTNTFTGDGYSEALPPEYRVGAAYKVSPALLLVMDGQKGMAADQADHVRLGVEKTAFGFLALRGGLHEIFGREEVRKLSLGFGLNSDGLGEAAPRQRLAINYAYEFGVDESEPLGGGQQFSLEVSF
jgi:hypothetical protein